MPVRLRLQRFGQKHLPYYRIVAADAKAPRDGRFIERVGNFNPIPDKHGIKEIRVNVEKARYWILKGAQPSDRVAWLFGKVGILPPKPVPLPNPETFRVPKA
ncbi:unnamed protein product, partial [Ectocarpus fasciculatus]